MRTPSPVSIGAGTKTATGIEMMTMRTKTFTKNAHGINIAKCCASCNFNNGVADNAGLRRICQHGEGNVKPSDYCRTWMMKPELDNVGLGGGRVNKKSYIDFVNNNIMKLSLSDIRAEFEKKNGSRYM